MIKKSIISAFSVYPYYKSSEGIVNKNWIDILLKKDVDLKILTSGGYNTSGNQKILSYIYKISKETRLTLPVLVYKTINKLCVTFFKRTLHNSLWVKFNEKELLKSITGAEVVWGRILPIISLTPILRVYQKVKFPYVVNINDPLVIGKDDINKITLEEKELIATKNSAQAWTFPSLRLANFVSSLYGLDKKRCFVIPHAMEENKTLYKRNSSFKKVNILYTGTFYKSAFTDELQEGLKEFCNSELFENVYFTFVLSQYDDDSIQWLKETIPGVCLKFKLDREEVVELIKLHDCMFVVDAESHKDLLKGKLVEAISFGIPVFAATYKSSIMDKVVLEYGGVSSYQDHKGDVYSKLEGLITSIQDESFFTEFYAQRKQVLFKISEENIFRMTKEISEFAYNRFHNLNIEISPEKLKEKYNWP